MDIQMNFNEGVKEVKNEIKTEIKASAEVGIKAKAETETKSSLNTLFKSKLSVSKQPIIILFGEPGVGKSTLAAKASKPYFIAIENPNVGELNGTFIKSFDELNSVLDAFLESPKAEEINTIVIDSLTALSSIVETKVLDDIEKSSPKGRPKSITDDNFKELNYMKGYVVLSEYFLNIISKIKKIRDEKGYRFILTGHQKKGKDKTDFMNPDVDVLTVDINEKVYNRILEQVDFVLCLDKEFTIKTLSGGQKIPVDGKRVLRIGDPAVKGKVREVFFNQDIIKKGKITIGDKTENLLRYYLGDEDEMAERFEALFSKEFSFK